MKEMDLVLNEDFCDMDEKELLETTGGCNSRCYSSRVTYCRSYSYCNGSLTQLIYGTTAGITSLPPSIGG